MLKKSPCSWDRISSEAVGYYVCECGWVQTSIEGGDIEEHIEQAQVLQSETPNEELLSSLHWAATTCHVFSTCLCGNCAGGRKLVQEYCTEEQFPLNL